MHKIIFTFLILNSFPCVSFETQLFVNNNTKHLLKPQGWASIDYQNQSIDHYDLPTINFHIEPFAQMVPLDKVHKNLTWWGLISFLIFDDQDNLLVACLEDTYWAAPNEKNFVITISEDNEFGGLACSHN